MEATERVFICWNQSGKKLGGKEAAAINVADSSEGERPGRQSELAYNQNPREPFSAQILEGTALL